MHGAADQCVALVEASSVDAIIVAGGDNGFNHLFVQPEIERIADLRGRTLVADVANTGWSFVLYEILRRHGLSRGDITIHEAGAPFRRFEAMRDDKTMAAAILNPPFAIHARRAGLKDMGAVVDTIGPYLGTVPYVLRPWAHANAETLAAYLRPASKACAGCSIRRTGPRRCKLAAERLNVPADIAAEIHAAARDPVTRPGQGRRVRPRRLQDRAEAPRRLRGPHRRAAGEVFRSVIPPAGPRRPLNLAAEQRHNGHHEQKASGHFQAGAGRRRRLANPGASIPEEEVRYIKGFKTKAEVDEWLNGSRKIDWLRSQGYAK